MPGVSAGPWRAGGWWVGLRPGARHCLQASWAAQQAPAAASPGRGGPPVREEDAALEEGVRGAPRQPLYPLHQRRVYRLAPKLQAGGGSAGGRRQAWVHAAAAAAAAWRLPTRAQRPLLCSPLPLHARRCPCRSGRDAALLAGDSGSGWWQGEGEVPLPWGPTCATSLL